MRVRNSDRSAAAGAQVSLAPAVDERVGGEIVDSLIRAADDDGWVRVELPPSWVQTRLVCSADSTDGLRASGSRNCAAGESIELVLASANRVRGRILGLRAGEWQRARVLAYSPEWPESPGRRSIPVAEDGSFAIGGLQRYVALVAHVSGRAPSRNWASDLPRAIDDFVELELGGDSAESVVHLVDSRGGDLPAGTRGLVSASGRAWLGAQVDAAGRMQLPGVEPGSNVRLVVWAAKSGVPSQWSTVKSEFSLSASEIAQAPKLTIPDAMRATFRISDPSGIPLVRLPVSARELGRPPEDTRWVECETGGDGLALPFTRLALPAGEYALATASGIELWRGPVTRDTSEVTVRANLVPLTVELRSSDQTVIRTANASVGLVRRGASPEADVHIVKRPGFSTFEESATVNLFAPGGDLRDLVVRVLYRWHGHEDLELASGRHLEIVASEQLGAVKVTGSGVSREAVLTLDHQGDSRVRYEVSDWDGIAKRVACVVPGTYTWTLRDINGTKIGEGVVGVTRGLTSEFSVR